MEAGLGAEEGERRDEQHEPDGLLRVGIEHPREMAGERHGEHESAGRARKHQADVEHGQLVRRARELGLVQGLERHGIEP